MEHIICFIDDSKFEHDLVRNEIAPLARNMTFVQTYTFEEAREELGSNKPALFLLDLWGQDEDVQKPYITPKEEIGTQISAFPTLDTVYKGLDEFKGDVTNEYLKRSINPLTVVEVLFALYFLFGISLAFIYQDFGLLPFHIMLFLGFAYVSILSISHSLKSNH